MSRVGPAAVVVLWAFSFVSAFALLLAFSIRDTPPSVASSARVPFDGGFEDGLGSWRAIAGTRLEQSRGGARFGHAFARATAASAASYGLFWPSAASAPEGERYEVVAWLKGAGSAVGNRAYVQVNELGGPSRGRVLVSVSRLLERRWTRFRAAGTVAGQGRVLDVYVFVPRPRGVGEAVYVDRISLRRTGETGR